MSDQQINALLVALAATPYSERATRDALITAMERTANGKTAPQSVKTADRRDIKSG